MLNSYMSPKVVLNSLLCFYDLCMLLPVTSFSMRHTIDFNACATVSFPCVHKCLVGIQFFYIFQTALTQTFFNMNLGIHIKELL